MGELMMLKGERWEIRKGEDDYPAALYDLEHPPEVLYGMGERDVLDTMCLGVIGARRPTPYGLVISAKAGRVAAESGITVVSGGALGCDAAAGRGALNAGGKTIVVSGVGADRIYPRFSEDVFRRATSGGGAVVSLLPWGTEVHRGQFIQRNAIIAALSTALVVAEAGERSGTASTAHVAFDLGREVYAVPGSIFSPESRGANALIRDGAAIITSEEDLELLISRDFGVLRMLEERPATPQGRLLSALIASPMRPDDLANHLGKSPLEVLRQLADYEVRGVVQRLPDGRYAPTQETYLARDTIGGQQ